MTEYYEPTYIEVLDFLMSKEPDTKLVIGVSNKPNIKREERDSLTYKRKITTITELMQMDFSPEIWSHFAFCPMLSPLQQYSCSRIQQKINPEHRDVVTLKGTYIDIYIPVEKQTKIPLNEIFPCNVITLDVHYYYYWLRAIKEKRMDC